MTMALTHSYIPAHLNPTHSHKFSEISEVHKISSSLPFVLSYIFDYIFLFSYSE
jgi:hypothetical protein